MYSAKIKAILCLNGQSLTSVGLACVLLALAAAASVGPGAPPFRGAELEAMSQIRKQPPSFGKASLWRCTSLIPR